MVDWAALVPMSFKDLTQPKNRLVVYRASSHGGAWVECAARTAAVIELSREDTVKLRDYLTRLLGDL